MTTLLIVAGVFGMMCYVAWWNWEHSTITLTMVDPPVVVKRGEGVLLEWRIGTTEQPCVTCEAATSKHRVGNWVFRSEPTYSAADDLQVKFKVEGE